MTYSARLLGGVVAAAALLGFAGGSFAAPPTAGGLPKLQRDGTINMAGQSLRCGKTRNVLDRALPSEGAAAPGVLIINPRLISRMPPVVRVFVFHHECGHHNIGRSELRADAWAVERGVQEGWLDANGLKQVCRSFGNMPATPTHPSGRARCRNLDKSFARAMAKLQKKPAAETASVPAAEVDKPALVSGPALVGDGKKASTAAKASKSAASRTRTVR